MSWRRLRVLIQHLPPESHTMTALRNATPAEELGQADESEPEKAPWSKEQMLLASVYDRLARVEHVLICANTDKKKWPTPPEPLRRPGVVPGKTKPALTESSADRLFQLINGGAA